MSETVGRSARRIDTGSNPPPGGNHGTITENVNSRMMPSRKKGTDDSSMNGGTRKCRNRGERGQAMRAPSTEPTKNEMTVETVKSPSVHGTADWIFSTTGCGKSTSDTPRPRLKMLPQ